MRKASKQANVQTLSLKFDGGLNYADAPANIDDNELTGALNIIYNQMGVPETRPGTTVLTTVTPTGTADSPLVKGYYYEKSSTTAYHIGICESTIYSKNGTGWTTVGSLAVTDAIPSMITYNSKLIIADGGTNLMSWDGTTFSATLTDGLSADAITSIKGRIVANSTTSPDLVTLSGLNDETMWDTADETNPALAFRAGFGDNMSVVGFEVFGDDLLIFKRGESEKKVYRLNTSDPTVTNWYVAEQTSNNSMQNAHCSVAAFNNIYFVDDDGFKSLKGVTEYGDLQVDFTGAKINRYFNNANNATCDEVTFIPKYNSVWFLTRDQAICFFLLKNGKTAFTNLQFKCGRIRSVYQADNTVYLCGDDGYLYKLDDSVSTDAVISTTTEFHSLLTSKQFSFTSQGVLRKTQIYLSPIKAGAALLTLATDTTGSIPLKTITLGGDGILINDMTEEIDTYTDTIYELGDAAAFELSYNRARGRSMQFSFSTSSGRVGLEGIKAEIALVGN